MADADRLQAIQDHYSRAVEARITDLMARVHAARQINSQIGEAEGQIELGRGDLAVIEEDLEQVEEGSEDHEALTEQAEALRTAIADTESYREELINALNKLAGEIRG